MSQSRGRWGPSIALLGLILAGGGTKAPHQSSPSLPVLKVQVGSLSPLSALPLTVAQHLGFFQDQHLNVRLTSQPESIQVTHTLNIQPAVGWLSIRPDMVLLAPVPDPHFRLRALNALSMPYSRSVEPEKGWAETIFSRHRAKISDWQPMSFSAIESVWKRHHLPWVLVNLSQAVRLKALDPDSVILAWLGASTGPIPAITVQASHPESSQVTHFLAALNLALWYLHTTPARMIQHTLGTAGPSASAIRAALHYQYWPDTTYPDEAAYNRARAWLSPTWPPYPKAVTTKAAVQALMDAGK